MDVIKAIEELRAELARIDATIARLEQMQADDQQKPRVWNSAARKAAAERMRAYWAARKSGGSGEPGQGTR